jgi:hypothetical protein
MSPRFPAGSGSGSSSTGDHILWLSSGTNAEPASPGQWWRHGHHHLVGRDRERYHLVDDRRTGRPGRLELYVDGWSRASGTAAATSTSALFGIYRWGWGFSTSQDFNGDIA